MMRVMKHGKSLKVTLLMIVTTMTVTAVPQTTSDSRIHGEFTRTLKVDGKVNCSLKSTNGAITVQVGSDDEVQIYSAISAGTKGDCDRDSSAKKVRAFEENHAIDQQGNTIRIGYRADSEMGHCTLINYEIRVPAATALEIESKYGGVKIYEVNGPINIISEAGTIRIKDPGGEVIAKNKVGSIEVVGTPGKDWFLEAGLGGVEIRLPKDAAFDLDAEARDGDIHTEFPMKGKSVGKSRRTFLRLRDKERAYLQGAVNGGGPLIRIKTKMGGVQVLER